MERVEQLPGVLVASYEDWVQIDPDAPTDEIVATLVAVRDIIVELGPDREATFVAVYPGDPYVETEFTTRVLDDAEKFENDARTWASLLDDGFSSVRYNVFDETGDGVLNVHADEPGEPGHTVADAFDAMVGALGAPRDRYVGLQTEALVGDVLVTNRTGSLELPPGWATAIDAIDQMEFVARMNVQFREDATTMTLSGSELTAAELDQLMTVLTGKGVLEPWVSVTYSAGRESPPVVLYGAAP